MLRCCFHTVCLYISIGTGCNACYMESLHKVGLWEGDYEQPEQVRVMTSHNIPAGIQYKAQVGMCV